MCQAYDGERKFLEASSLLRNEIELDQTTLALLGRIAELEAAVLAAKVLLEPTDDDKTEAAWQALDQAYHQWKS